MTSPVRAPRPTPRSLPATRSTEHVRPDLRIVGPPRRRARTGLVVAAATIVVFGALFAGAVAHSLLVSAQVNLDEVQADTRRQEQLLEEEQLTLAELQSPARITAEAERLGLVPPEDGGTWVSPGSGAPVDTRPEPAEPGVTADAGELAGGTGTAVRP